MLKYCGKTSVMCVFVCMWTHTCRFLRIMYTCITGVLECVSRRSFPSPRSYKGAASKLSWRSIAVSKNKRSITNK